MHENQSRITEGNHSQQTHEKTGLRVKVRNFFKGFFEKNQDSALNITSLRSLELTVPSYFDRSRVRM